jgi:hypothetical protein
VYRYYIPRAVGWRRSTNEGNRTGAEHTYDTTYHHASRPTMKAGTMEVFCFEKTDEEAGVVQEERDNKARGPEDDIGRKRRARQWLTSLDLVQCCRIYSVV